MYNRRPKKKKILWALGLNVREMYSNWIGITYHPSNHLETYTQINRCMLTAQKQQNIENDNAVHKPARLHQRLYTSQ
jgi:hypothetical protein